MRGEELRPILDSKPIFPREFDFFTLVLHIFSLMLMLWLMNRVSRVLDKLDGGDISKYPNQYSLVSLIFAL